MPGQDLDAAKAEIAACVLGASRDHPFLSNNPPEVIWNGFQAEGYVLGEDADSALAEMQSAYETVCGSGERLQENKMTALTDTRFYGLYYGIPSFCIGARGGEHPRLRRTRGSGVCPNADQGVGRVHRALVRAEQVVTPRRSGRCQLDHLHHGRVHGV